jgi:release factor glutamine methyltransferase
VDQPVHVLDLCTGSGAIAITLAAERPNAHVVATDLSAEALEIAAANARVHGVSERVSLRQGDLFAALEPGGHYDLIAANPPYVRDDERAELAGELHHEPTLALYGGAQGLDVLTRLCAEVASWLAPNGTSLFEVGAGQAQSVLQLLAANERLTQLSTQRDLGGIERVVEAHLVGPEQVC